MVVATGLVRLNVGCGDYPLPQSDGWMNIDSSQDSKADVVVSMPPITFPDNLVGEIYAGHFLEHLDREAAAFFLAECYRVLKPGGEIGIVVPDTREIMRRYLGSMGDYGQTADGRIYHVSDLDDVCAYWLFSTVQTSHHQWAYDLGTLKRAMRQAGFEIIGEIDRHNDPRLGTGQWYQCGVGGVKRG